MAGGVITTLGLSRLKQLEESVSLSVPPSLDFKVDQLNKQVPDIVLSNTGQHALKEIVIWRIRYEERNGEITSRMAPNMGIPVADLLLPKNQISIPADRVMGASLKPRTEKDLKENLNQYVVFVVLYRREADNRRFVDIETAIWDADVNGQLMIFHYLNSASGGCPQHLLKIMREMVENERFIFKAKEQ